MVWGGGTGGVWWVAGYHTVKVSDSHLQLQFNKLYIPRLHKSAFSAQQLLTSYTDCIAPTLPTPSLSLRGRGPAGSGPTDIRSTPFTTAAAPTPTPSCGQPQAVTNIRREGAQLSGSMIQMVRM
jgi:hypothetical protein